MNVFYYTWFENSEQDMMEALTYLGHSVVKCHIPFNDYEDDIQFTASLEQIFQEQECDVFFSFNFFPMIAKVAHRLERKYVSWVYDMPHLTLFSPAVKSEYTTLFVFDKMQYQQMKEIKPSHLYHMPLAVNTSRLNKLLGNTKKSTDSQQGISFVGSLYENNMYRQVQDISSYLKGYVNGIAEVQQKICGYNLVAENLNDEVIRRFEKYICMNMDKSYLITQRQLYADMINAEITFQERKNLITALAERYRFTIYTNSDASFIPKAESGGVVSYDREMPQIFRKSKINLNVTLRSITSGIPLRALDIMGAGGFLLSNYQPELAEYFEDGYELVLFKSREDMLEKAAYYMKHEKERKDIAYQGWKKIQQKFSYEVQLKKIFEIVDKE